MKLELLCHIQCQKFVLLLISVIFVAVIIVVKAGDIALWFGYQISKCAQTNVKCLKLKDRHFLGDPCELLM